MESHEDRTCQIVIKHVSNTNWSTLVHWCDRLRSSPSEMWEMSRSDHYHSYVDDFNKPTVLSRFNSPLNSFPAGGDDQLCKQFGPRSGQTFCRAWSGSKPFDTLMVFPKELFVNINFGGKSTDVIQSPLFKHRSRCLIQGLTISLQNGPL